MHKFSKNIDASSKYLGPDVYKRSKALTEVQQSWSDLYVTAIRRLLVAACKLINVFVCGGKETVIIVLQYLVPPLQHVLDQNLCTPGVYNLLFDSPPRKSCVMWTVLKQEWTYGCTWQSEHQHTHTHSLYLSEHHTVYTQDVFLWGPVFLLTGGNLSGTFSCNRHIGGEFIEGVPTDADGGNSGWWQP